MSCHLASLSELFHDIVLDIVNKYLRQELVHPSWGGGHLRLHNERGHLSEESAELVEEGGDFHLGGRRHCCLQEKGWVFGRPKTGRKGKTYLSNFAARF